MNQTRSTQFLTRLVAYIVMVYGLSIIAGSLVRELRAHGRDLDLLLISVPQVAGLGFVYLGSLLLRRKYNAWLAAQGLFSVSLLLDVIHLTILPRVHVRMHVWQLLLPVMILVLLWLTRASFRVRSDLRSFTQAIRFSLIALLIAFLYGIGGFTLLDERDFHQDMPLTTAAHETIDQFGLTTHHPVAETPRARLFLDSLPVISIAALGYVAISFFDPIRMRFASQSHDREHAEQLLRDYPSDLDDFFKLWPHDKHYYFDTTGRAGLAYQVNRGVALVVADPFGDAKRFKQLLERFMELCFVNDWQPTFVHVTERNRRLYERAGLRLQKIGEEAVLDLAAFQQIRHNKYFRQIGNKFTKLGYTTDVLLPPHDKVVTERLAAISKQWLSRPGREERGFMLGYYTPEYLQFGAVAIVRDDAGTIQGFMNLVPTYEPKTANYDLLRCSNQAPGNCNDFVLLGLIDMLVAQGIHTLNLGLCPLAGLDEKADDASLIDTALRFVYANGDRFYSFSGLRRFKSKYQPAWEPRYVAYRGGIAGFTRAMAALNRAMKVK